MQTLVCFRSAILMSGRNSLRWRYLSAFPIADVLLCHGDSRMPKLILCLHDVPAGFRLARGQLWARKSRIWNSA